MFTLQLNTAYTFNLTGELQFGPIAEEHLYEMFKDGRICSTPMSLIFEQVFYDLEYVDEKGYDFIHPLFPFIEQKQITANGLKFAPSSMIGAGRKCDRALVENHVQQLDLHYLLADITQFPIVRVALLPGVRLLDDCHNQTCSYSLPNALRLFKDATQSQQKCS